ncbi:glycosyltransferase [Sphingobacterium sp.]|uniref:glycosyltransferase n=1 Tax=Sphingobacterium sp. TaxID=341027 RepID=UPI0028A5ACAC|nr:glycosyltransferase [Sphingobacterium sp.]
MNNNRDNYFIVILNWNGWKDTQLCIESILKNTLDNNFNIILVDNGSSIDEIKEIKEYCNERFDFVINDSKEVFLDSSFSLPKQYHDYKNNKKIIFIENNENLGFAIGNNIALRMLRTINVKYALLLNNDTEVTPRSLSNMYTNLLNHEKNKVVAVIPQIRYFSPNNLIWNCGGNINWLGIRKYLYPMKDVNNFQLTGNTYVDYGTGCAILFDLEKVGLLSEKYFFGEEDFEMAYRIKRNKGRILCTFDSIIYHKVGASRVKISDKKISNMVYHYSQRMANLKDQLPIFTWYLSLIAHMLSSARLLVNSSLFSLKRFKSMWEDILHNVKSLDKFSKEDFLRISSKSYR